MSFIFSKTISILYFRISSNAPIQKLQQGQKKDVVASIPSNIGEKIWSLSFDVWCTKVLNYSFKDIFKSFLTCCVLFTRTLAVI